MQDGRRLISASVDGTAKIWDTNSGQATATLAYHANKVYASAANDDATMAATVGSDKKIAIWDLRNTQRPVFVNEESTASVTCVDFSND